MPADGLHHHHTMSKEQNPTTTAAWLHPIGCGGHGAGEGFPFETAGSNHPGHDGPAGIAAGELGGPGPT